MPKSRKNPDRKLPKKHNAADGQANELYVLAKRVTHELDDPKHPRWDEKLTERVMKHLRAGEDAVIDQAIEKAATADDLDTMEVLQFAAEFGAQSHILGETEDDALVVGHLFVVPIIVSDVRALSSGNITENQHFLELIQSFKTAGVIESSQWITLVNYLYHPAEVAALPWSYVLRKGKEIAKSFQPSAPLPRPAHLAQTGWPADVERSAQGVRFLVGVISDTRDPDVPFQEPDDEQEATVWAATMATWEKTAGILLKSALGENAHNEAVVVARPGLYFRAIEGSLTEFKLLDAQEQLAGILGQNGVTPDKLNAVVAMYQGEDGRQQVMASLASALDNSFLGAIAIDVERYENGFRILGAVDDFLEEKDLQDVQLLDEIVPLTRCETCGAPMVLSPSSDGGALSLVHSGPAHTSPTMH